MSQAHISLFSNPTRLSAGRVPDCDSGTDFFLPERIRYDTLRSNTAAPPLLPSHVPSTAPPRQGKTYTASVSGMAGNIAEAPEVPAQGYRACIQYNYA